LHTKGFVTVVVALPAKRHAVRSFSALLALALLSAVACITGSGSPDGGGDAASGHGGVGGGAAGGTGGTSSARGGAPGGTGGTAAAGAGGGAAASTGGAAGCSEISFTQTICVPDVGNPGGTSGGAGGTGGSSSGTGGSGFRCSTQPTQCRSIPAQCASDPHCACICPPGLPCYGLSCQCSESNGVVFIHCTSD